MMRASTVAIAVQSPFAVTVAIAISIAVTVTAAVETTADSATMTVALAVAIAFAFVAVAGQAALGFQSVVVADNGAVHLHFMNRAPVNDRIAGEVAAMSFVNNAFKLTGLAV